MSSQIEESGDATLVREVCRSQYSRDASTSNPFDVTAASGSEWNKDHLDWLGVDLEDGHKPENLISGGWKLQQSSKICRTLTQFLDAPWSDIQANDYPGQGLGGIYDDLELLGRRNSSIHAPVPFDSSTPLRPIYDAEVDGSPLERTTKRTRMSTTSPEKQSESSIRMSESPSVHQTKRPRAEAEGGTMTSPDVPPASSPPSADDEKATTPDVTTASSPASSPSALPIMSRLPIGTASSPYLPSRISDRTYCASSESPSAQPDHSRSSQEDKHEPEVVRAASSLLYIIKRTVGQIDKGMQIDVRLVFRNRCTGKC
jgi:hypothetical protein